jgi:hypothetical protein
MTTLGPTNFVCESCGSSSATYFCICQHTILHMCPPCAYVHSSKSHCPLRLLTSFADISEEITRTFESDRHASCYSQLKAALRLNELKVHLYGQYLEDVRETIMREAEQWYARARDEVTRKAEGCFGWMEDIRRKIERMERRELPEDVFEEALRNVSDANVKEIAAELTLFDFIPSTISLLSLLSSLPDPSLHLPSTIGQKHIFLSYENSLIPITVDSTDPESLIPIIKQVLCLQEDPCISPGYSTPGQRNDDMNYIRHGTVLRVDCDTEVSIEGDKEAKITVKRKETVRNLIMRLGELWKVEESRIHLYGESEELQDMETISAQGYASSVHLRCEIHNMLILKQKLALQRFEVMFTSSDTPLDLKHRTGLHPSTLLHLSSRLLIDHFPLCSQGVSHQSIVEYELISVETCEIFVVLASGKRKPVSCPHLHIGIDGLWEKLVELKAVKGDSSAVKFIFEGSIVGKESYLDDFGVKNKSILQISRA